MSKIKLSKKVISEIDALVKKNLDSEEINIETFTGNKSFSAYTMELTKKYIEINADYRS